MRNKLFQAVALLLVACMLLSHSVHLSSKLPFFSSLQQLIRLFLELFIVFVSFLGSFLIYKKLGYRLILGMAFFAFSRFCGLFIVNEISILIWNSKLLESRLEVSGFIAYIFIDNWTRNMYYYEYFFSSLIIYVIYVSSNSFRQVHE